MVEGIKKIGFDADDTLWVNELFFRETEQHFYKLLADYADESTISSELYRTESNNMFLYGYGVKAFILSVLETAHHITQGNVPASIVREIIDLGKKQLLQPVELLPSVEDTLNALVGSYELILVTKGDLLDQERKLAASGLEHLFHHVEVMSDKTECYYRKLLKHIDLRPDEFMMVGNSLRSDILPPLILGSYAVYVPCEMTWEHEKAEEPTSDPRFFKVDSLWEILRLLP
ncbi:MAG: HAD family hydrolase [Massilibacteroides sp.]|nr:HAD family hydrolase [Massilibacteroides sp.]MDD3062454.1 HAD family hydrolase [Massilibacteroides sp.]MDD4114827.1 HAD family hydrolase [Massilibacteroides sp.]MDD4659857.1 HAD family hydrolase [Massilibacteroides sp.]